VREQNVLDKYYDRPQYIFLEQTVSWGGSSRSGSQEIFCFLNGTRRFTKTPRPHFVFEIRDFFKDGDIGGLIILKWTSKENVWNGFFLNRNRDQKRVVVNRVMILLIL
jgi:hypothetical protein